MKTIKEMKAKLQAKKQDNKGFSLVELIIVIAIMAILVGIIASQVIPYMEKSRESKDISFLDTCLTSIQTAYADNECTKDIDGLTLSQMCSNADSSIKAVGEEVAQLIGVPASTNLGTKTSSKKSKNAGADVDVTFTVKNNGGTAEVKVECQGLKVDTTNGACK